MGDLVNIFLLLDMSLAAVLEAGLLTGRWDAGVGGSKLTSFYDTSILLGQQKVSLVET